jgi:site-specific recombinase XerC
VRVRPASTARNGHDDDPGQHLDLHELRHTGATVIFQRTGDLNAGRAQLGHAKESMTINYIHPGDERGLEVVDAAYTAQVVPLRPRQVS